MSDPIGLAKRHDAEMRKAINNYRDAMTDPSDNFTVPSVAIAMGFPMDSKILMSLHIKQKGLSVF